MTRAARVAVCLAALTCGRVALAADGPPVVVVRGSDDAPAPDEAAIQRLAAELTLLGLRVHIAPAAAPAPEPPSARIVLEAARGKVEILFLDATTGMTTLRQQLDAPPAPDTAALLVVRTVELVRAVLLPPPLAAPPHAAAPATLVVAEPPAASPSHRLAVTLGAGALATGGEVGAAATLAFAARVRVAGPFGLELLALAPLTRAETATPEGRGQLTTWVAGGGVFVGASRGRLAFDAALGALALWLRTDGTPAAGFVETQDSTVGAAAHARLGAAWSLGPQLAARVDLLGGGLLRRPVLTFPDSAVRPAWSRAFAGAVVSVEARF